MQIWHDSKPVSSVRLEPALCEPETELRSVLYPLALLVVCIYKLAIFQSVLICRRNGLKELHSDSCWCLAYAVWSLLHFRNICSIPEIELMS